MNEVFQALHAHGYRTHEIYSRDEWLAHRESGEFRTCRELEERFAATGKLPFTGPGWCGVCRSWTTLELSARHSNVDASGALQLAFSETAVCRVCRTNSRMRAAGDMLASVEPLLPPGGVYITEQKTNLFRALSATRPALIGSEYLSDVRAGAAGADGVRCEDLTSLSFPTASLAAVISLDVLEHVADPSAALREIARVLAQGGYAVLTFPFFPSFGSSRRRAVLKNGQVEHLLEPVFHGNPISPDGALVFNDFGWDFVEEASGLFAERAFFFYQSFVGWHFGPSRFAMILKA